MILKGSQRGNGADLAIHLMNGFDNERIEVAEVYGTVAGDLAGAFAEFEAVAAGTRASQPLYSLSINPSALLTREQYFEAIAIIEHRLALTDQPRAVIFHVKRDNGGIPREHCHIVWSRIDVENMRAIQMAHDRRKLMDLACDLAHKYGLDLPPGLKAWEEKRRHEKDRLEPTLGEKAQEQETGISPEQRREEITAAYERSDTAEAFRAALEEKGYILARGDRRGMVVVDRFGAVHSLTRYIKGHTGKHIKAKLAALTPEQLPSVAQAKELAAQRAQAQQERQREQDRADEERQRDLAEARSKKEEALAATQTARQLEVRQAEQELLMRQQAERLALHAAQKSESRRFLFRVRSAVVDLIRRTPGLRSVLSHIQKRAHLDPKERHRLEDEALARRHGRERLEIERHKRTLARVEIREKRSLERALRKEQRLQEATRLATEQAAGQAREAKEMLAQAFSDAAQGLGLPEERAFGQGELTRTFNREAGAAEDQDASGDDDDRAPSWKQRAEKRIRGHRPRRGKGPRYRRDS